MYQVGYEALLHQQSAWQMRLDNHYDSDRAQVT